MEAVVDQSLGDVVNGDTARCRKPADVKDALVRDEPINAGVENGVVVGQPPGNVVCPENRDLRGLKQSVWAHHPDVGPWDRQDSGTPPW